MITFRTQFPVSVDADIFDLLEAGKLWILNSPHTTLKEKIKAAEIEGDELIVKSGKELFRIEICFDKNPKLFGIYHAVENSEGFDWLTQVVAKKDNNEFWVTVQTSCESKCPTRNFPSKRPTKIVGFILDRLGPGKDGAISVSSFPLNLRDTDIDFAAKIINGQARNVMPVAYVSTTSSQKHVINPAKLSRELYGLAHVIVEPNREFSYRLRIDTSSQNAYGGAIGLYWPEGLGKELLYRDGDHDEFIRKIKETVQDALLARRLLEGCTWNDLEQRKISMRLNEYRESVRKESDEKNEFIRTFDRDIYLKDRKIEDAENEIKRLQKEVYKLSAQIPIQKEGDLLNRGTERDLFESEMADFVIEILEKELSNSIEGTRRRHLLKSLINANEKKGHSVELRERMKKVFSSYDSMNATLRSKIKDLGFQIADEGKHYKLIFLDDPRYMITVPKTPSDSRSGKNLASDATRLLF